LDGVRAGFEIPFVAMVENNTNPILLVGGSDADAPAERRFFFANAAARAVLPIQRHEGLLTTALRAPAVLEAVDEALFGEGVGEASFQSGGVKPRTWRVRAIRLRGADETRLAMLSLSDETEELARVRSRTDFLTNASHELRTPLASLTGFIETLSNHAKDDAAARERFLPIMQGQADRMRRLIDNLMSLSSIEQAEHLAPSAKVDVAGATIEVVEALGPQARSRTVNLNANLTSPTFAIGDRDQILQVIQNLVENALKYAPPGSAVTLELATDLELQDALRPTRIDGACHCLLTPVALAESRYVALRVTDTGQGIANTNLPRLTERFYRVEGQRSGEHAGTGLGLAIVKHIMNRHRGGLVVESAPGEGSTFRAYFPAAPP